MARNFLKLRGRAAFATLLDMLEKQESGQSIANTFKVSRERARHWRDAFGETVTLYRVYPEVQRYLPKPRPSKVRPSKVRTGHHPKCEWSDCQGGCFDLYYEGG
jgi:hypothetical protein